jgi:hypothetical protein
MTPYPNTAWSRAASPSYKFVARVVPPPRLHCAHVERLKTLAVNGWGAPRRRSSHIGHGVLTGSLFAPGVAQLGIELDRLLVARPELKDVERVAVRIVEAKVVSVLVIDLRGALAGDLSVDGPKWQRTIRRLSLAVKQMPTCVLVITRAEPRLALPLPVAMRLEFNRLSSDSFEVRVAKERTGRISRPHGIAWSAFTTGAAQAAP